MAALNLAWERSRIYPFLWAAAFLSRAVAHGAQSVSPQLP